MFKVFAILYMIMNISNNIFSNYSSLSAPIHDMKEFIENQQYREDQLRSQCQLSNVLIEPKKNLYHQIYDDLKYYITDTLPNTLPNTLPYLMLYNSDIPIVCNSFDEFIYNSHYEYNVNKELIYNDKIFLLKNSEPPQWIIKIDNLIIDIFDIKSIHTNL